MQKRALFVAVTILASLMFAPSKGSAATLAGPVASLSKTVIAGLEQVRYRRYYRRYYYGPRYRYRRHYYRSYYYPRRYYYRHYYRPGVYLGVPGVYLGF